MTIRKDERLKWWHEARFGMFIHWGLYAELAGEWKGEKIPGIGEWIMRNAKIPIEEYEKLAKDFNPVKFDADEWAELALQAGMKYLVITAKHHDGFCMFNSISNPYNIVARTPFKRDPMKELAAACNKRGIKMCFYYSQALDWHAPGGAGHWDEVGEGKGWLSYARPAEDFQNYLDDVVKPNLRELLTHYGPIGLIWFDTPVAITPEQSASLRDLVHELQPECLVSGRVGHDVGDYGSLGDNEHPSGKVKGAWETPATLNDTWGYKRDDDNWKSLDDLLGLLINCASKGVNYLLNVGPTAEGVIPRPSVDLLKQMGDWLACNGEAIYGTTGSPFPMDPTWGRVTCKNNMIYLIIKDWPEDELLLCGLRNQVKSARFLGLPEVPVDLKQTGDRLALSLAGKAPETLFPVIAVELDGPADVEDIIVQQGDLPIVLPADIAELKGDLMAKPSGIITGWTHADNQAAWSFRIKKPGTYTVAAVAKINRNCQELYGQPEMQAVVSGEKLTGQLDLSLLDMSEDVKVYQLIKTVLGQVTFERPGDYSLTLTADGFDPAATRGLTLTGIELAP